MLSMVSCYILGSLLPDVSLDEIAQPRSFFDPSARRCSHMEQKLSRVDRWEEILTEPGNKNRE